MGIRTTCVVLLAFVGCGKVTDPKPADVDAPGTTPDTPGTSDTTPPIVMITTTPMAVTESPNASFEFNSNEPATFQCRMDTGAFVDCGIPQTYANLTTGQQHTFTVHATDPAGNVGMASYSWMVLPACVPALVEGESLTAPGWSMPMGSVLHNGAEIEAGGANMSFTFNFTAKGLIVHTEDGPNRGQISFTVDSGTPVSVDTFQSGSFSFQIAHPITSGLLNTSHAVTVLCTAPICSIDYFDLTCQ